MHFMDYGNIASQYVPIMPPLIAAWVLLFYAIYRQWSNFYLWSFIAIGIAGNFVLFLIFFLQILPAEYAAEAARKASGSFN